MAQWNCIPATPSMSAASCWWSGAHLTALPRPESTALIVKRAADAQRLAAADALDQPPGPCTASDSWQIEDPLDAEPGLVGHENPVCKHANREKKPNSRREFRRIEKSLLTLENDYLRNGSAVLSGSL